VVDEESNEEFVMIDTKKNLKDLKIGVKRKQQNVLTQP
jgi:hypothetical protein